MRIALLIAVVACAGCGPYMRTPRLFGPGPVGPQRTDAIYHDPYPLDDIGPPVVGGRPRGYQNPVPPVVRGRLTQTTPTLIPQPPITPPPQPPITPPPQFQITPPPQFPAGGY